MRLVIILTAIFIFFQGCLSQNGREEKPIKVKLPSSTKELKEDKKLWITG